VFSGRLTIPETPNRWALALAEARKRNRACLDLTLSNPTVAEIPYDYDALFTALVAEDAKFYRPEPLGLFCARNAISDYYRSSGLDIPPEHIVLTSSTSEAYSFLTKLLCDPGDIVLVPAPSYPLFDFLFSLDGVEPRHYPLFFDGVGWVIDTEAIALAVNSEKRVKAIVVINPNNPTGNYLKSGEFEQLLEIVSSRPIALISDEVFSEYPLGKGGKDIVRCAAISARTGLVFSLGGLSKSAGLPQMKASWMIVGGSEDIVTQALRRLEVICDTYLSVSTPIQLGIQRFLKASHIQREAILKRINGNLITAHEVLDGQAGVRLLEPEGGWYLCLKIGGSDGDEELAIRLLDKGVVVHPGYLYDFSDGNYLVVSLLTPSAGFRKGLEILAETLDFAS
jgi:aspartate/methionine/tyrosine aminotransferase